MVAGMFLVFFVVTMITLPLILQAARIDSQSRGGLLFMGVYQALVMFVAPSILAARVNSRHPAEVLALNRRPTLLALAGVVFGYFIALPAINQIIYWNSVISFPDSMAYWGEICREMEEKANASSFIMLNVSSWGAMLVNLAVIGLVTAFGEEIFFRGALQRTAASNGAHHTAIWVVALVFSAMHMSAFGFVPRLLLGAWFGYLMFWTRSLYVPIFAHFLNNGVVVVFAFLTARGAEFNFDRLGVVEYGFPFPAFISAVAFVVFIVFFRNFFFSRKEIDFHACPA